MIISKALKSIFLARLSVKTMQKGAVRAVLGDPWIKSKLKISKHVWSTKARSSSVYALLFALKVKLPGN